MAQLNSAAERLDEQLGDTALYEEASKERLKEVLKEKGEVERRLAEVEEQWLEASEELEELS
jgi:ATP-binding cassette subfamily F protein 3